MHALFYRVVKGLGKPVQGVNGLRKPVQGVKGLRKPVQGVKGLRKPLFPPWGGGRCAQAGDRPGRSDPQLTPPPATAQQQTTHLAPSFLQTNKEKKYFTTSYFSYCVYECQPYFGFYA